MASVCGSVMGTTRDHCTLVVSTMFVVLCGEMVLTRLALPGDLEEENRERERARYC